MFCTGTSPTTAVSDGSLQIPDGFLPATTSTLFYSVTEQLNHILCCLRVDWSQTRGCPLIPFTRSNECGLIHLSMYRRLSGYFSVSRWLSSNSEFQDVRRDGRLTDMVCGELSNVDSGKSRKS